jgi:ribulose-5-phosphate 4-epimerase/fuculose-1-phosphate aldolase
MAVTAMPKARMTQAESQTRIDLAACYRLVDMFGWSDLINTRITARVPGPQDHFLINRFGMLYDEITASSLVKVDVDGNKVEPSDDEVQ